MLSSEENIMIRSSFDRRFNLMRTVVLSFIVAVAQVLLQYSDSEFILPLMRLILFKLMALNP